MFVICKNVDVVSNNSDPTTNIIQEESFVMIDLGVFNYEKNAVRVLDNLIKEDPNNKLIYFVESIGEEDERADS